MEYPPRIEKLLEKYWDAETSVEEEREIRAYFLLHPEVSDRVAGYFRFLQSEHDEDVPAATEIKSEAPKVAVVRPLWRRVVSIAAGIAIIAVAVFALQNLNDESAAPSASASVQEIEDPNEAYEQAREALLLLASKMQSTQGAAAEQINKVEPYTNILR